jgi:hypothetical protein
MSSMPRRHPQIAIAIASGGERSGLQARRAFAREAKLERVIGIAEAVLRTRAI